MRERGASASVNGQQRQEQQDAENAVHGGSVMDDGYSYSARWNSTRVEHARMLYHPACIPPVSILETGNSEQRMSSEHAGCILLLALVSSAPIREMEPET